MHKIKLKPLSVNDAWQGRRFRTKAYNQFRRVMGILLNTIRPRLAPPPDKPLFAVYRCGQSNFLGADVDNPLKLIMDTLFEWWGCKERDRRVQFLIASKVPTKKGDEFIEFHVDTYERLIPYLEGLVEQLKQERGIQ